MTDYVQDFEDGLNGAPLATLGSLPAAGSLLVTGDEVVHSTEQVYAGSLALMMRNSAIDWTDAQETGSWPSASLSMWLRGHFTEEAESWTGTAHLTLIAVNAALDSIVSMEALLNAGSLSLSVTAFDGAFAPVDSNATSVYVAADEWLQLVVVAGGGFAEAKLLDANGTVLTAASIPWSETIAMVTNLTVSAGAGGAAQITYVDDIVLSLADDVTVASDDMGGVRQSFLRGR